MNKLLRAYLTGIETMANAANDVERLKFMPHRVEGGVLYNFNDAASFGGAVPGMKDVTIFEDKERIVNAQKCTSALKRDYFKAFNSFLDNNPVNEDDVAQSNDEPKEDPLYIKLYEAVEDGNKKEVRSICKELEEKWFALDLDVVEDAIDDIKACVKDKDVEEVRVIITETIEDIAHVENEDVNKENTSQKEATTTKPQSNDDEETLEIIADIEDAIKAEDWEDVALLLKQLGEDHPKYEEFNKQLPSNKEDDSKDDEDEINAILDDLDDALKENDIDGAKVILEELKEIVGEKDEDYIKYYALVFPPVEEESASERRRRLRREKAGK